jgi:hypothetical protein
MSREVLETMKREKRISTALVFRLNVIVKCQEFLAQVIKVYFQQVALLPVSHAGKYALIVRTWEKHQKDLLAGKGLSDPYERPSAFGILASRSVPRAHYTGAASLLRTALNILPSEIKPEDFSRLGNVYLFRFEEHEPVNVALTRFMELVDSAELAFALDEFGNLPKMRNLVMVFAIAFKATLHVGMPNETNLRALHVAFSKC